MFGLDTIDQVTPFQSCTSVWLTLLAFEYQPTATHDVVLAHDTESSSLSKEVDVFGLDTIDQVTPFQSSTSVWLTALAFEYQPTATQLEGDVQDMPLRKLSSGAAASAIGAIDHVPALQVAATVSSAVAVGDLVQPAAMQKFRLAHDTPMRCVVVEGDR